MPQTSIIKGYIVSVCKTSWGPPKLQGPHSYTLACELFITSLAKKEKKKKKKTPTTGTQDWCNVSYKGQEALGPSSEELCLVCTHQQIGTTVRPLAHLLSRKGNAHTYTRPKKYCMGAVEKEVQRKCDAIGKQSALTEWHNKREEVNMSKGQANRLSELVKTTALVYWQFTWLEARVQTGIICTWCGCCLQHCMVIYSSLWKWTEEERQRSRRHSGLYSGGGGGKKKRTFPKYWLSSLNAKRSYSSLEVIYIYIQQQEEPLHCTSNKGLSGCGQTAFCSQRSSRHVREKVTMCS